MSDIHPQFRLKLRIPAAQYCQKAVVAKYPCTFERLNTTPLFLFTCIILIFQLRGGVTHSVTYGDAKKVTWPSSRVLSNH